MEDRNIVSIFKDFTDAYELFFRPLCRELNMTQGALDILIFLYSNPEYNMAKDIVRFRGIKANLVSFHVDKLVNDGYLERHSTPEDRRKIRLICTQKAQDVVRKGQEKQREFCEFITKGLSENDFEKLQNYFAMISDNIETAKNELMQSTRNNFEIT